MTYLEKAVAAITVLLEAEGEPFLGKLAVAYVILNRMKHRKQSLYRVCWSRWQFSCWLPNVWDLIKRLENAPLGEQVESYRAVELAYERGIADPTDGATHYLNEALVIRDSGKLPSWVSKMTKTVTIKQHTFYKE